MALVMSSLLALTLMLWLLAGEVLSRPALHAVGDLPQDLRGEAVSIASPLPHAVSGWLVRGKPGSGVVLLLHGVRADRRDMVARARFLHQQAYTVLLIDLPAHGESAAERITYGEAESVGVTASINYLRRAFPNERLAVVGVSLGAASLVLAHPSPAPEAVVLESMFPTIEAALRNRMRLYFGPVGEWLSPGLLWQLSWRLGISPQQLRPVVALPALRSPVLIASGSADQHTTLAETRRLFAAANEPKQLWIVSGAGHVDLHAYAPAAYESTVSTFLAQHLRLTSKPQSTHP